LGFEAGLDRSFRQAPVFYWLYTVLIAGGAAVVMIPRFPMMTVSILSQVLNGVLLPFILFFMLRLINKKELMGKYTNTRWFNVVAWGTALIVVGLSVVMVWQALAPGA
jgi:Mn2+/Fe2+ NRAMP family transporter